MNLLVVICTFLFLIITFYFYFHYPQTKCEGLTVPSTPTTVPAVVITNQKNNNKIYLLGDTANHLYLFMVSNGKKSSFYVDFQLGFTIPIFSMVFPSSSTMFQILSTAKNDPGTSVPSNSSYPFQTPSNVTASYTNCIQFKNNYCIGFDGVDYSKCIIQYNSNSITTPNLYSCVFDFSISTESSNSFMYVSGSGISNVGYVLNQTEKTIVYKRIKPHPSLMISESNVTTRVGRITFSNSMYIDGSSSSDFLSFVGNNACVQYNCISSSIPLIEYWNFKPYDPAMYGSVIKYTASPPTAMTPSPTSPPTAMPSPPTSSGLQSVPIAPLQYFTNAIPLLYLKLPFVLHKQNPYQNFFEIDQLILRSSNIPNVAVLIQVCNPLMINTSQSTPFPTINKGISIQSILYEDGKIKSNPNATNIYYCNFNAGGCYNLFDNVTNVSVMSVPFTSSSINTVKNTMFTSTMKQIAPVQTAHPVPNVLICNSVHLAKNVKLSVQNSNLYFSSFVFTLAVENPLVEIPSETPIPQSEQISIRTSTQTNSVPNKVNSIYFSNGMILNASGIQGMNAFMTISKNKMDLKTPLRGGTTTPFETTV